MFTLRKDGRYQDYWRDTNGVRHTICDRDTEKLCFFKIQKKGMPAEPTFEGIANAWHDKVWASYREKTRACYVSIYQCTLDEQRCHNASEITAADISHIHMQKLATKRVSAKSGSCQEKFAMEG